MAGATSSLSLTAVRFSSAGEEQRGEGERLWGATQGDPKYMQRIDELADAVMKKLANSNPSKTGKVIRKSDIEQHLCRIIPVIRTPNHPTYAVMIQKAIDELNEEHGSTEEAISKFIQEKFEYLPWAHARFLNIYLKKLIESGEIVCASNNCYMLPAKYNDYLSRRERVKRKKRSQRIKDRRTSAKVIGDNNLAGELVVVTETQREQEQQSKEPEHGEEIQVTIQEEQCRKMIEFENGSTDKQLQIALTFERQNVELMKYTMNEEQVEVTEQQMEHGKQSQEPIEEQQSKTVDCLDGSSKQQHGQKNSNQMQVLALVVEQCSAAEHTCNATVEQQVEVNEQQEEHGQQSRDEHNNRVIDSRNGSQEEQNEEKINMDGDQIQEILVSCEKQCDTHLKYKADVEQRGVSLDEIEEHIEGVRRNIQFQVEMVEAIEKMTKSYTQHGDVISERNRLQEQTDLISKFINSSSMQELSFKKQEKNADIVVNSNPSLTSQKLPSNLSKEKCSELLWITRKLQKDNVNVQKKTLQMQAKLFEWLKELSHTNPDPIIKERPMLPSTSTALTQRWSDMIEEVLAKPSSRAERDVPFVCAYMERGDDVFMDERFSEFHSKTSKGGSGKKKKQVIPLRTSTRNKTPTVKLNL